MEALSIITIPTDSPKVYKDECLLSYDTPDSPDGLFVCMKTFYGFGKKQVEQYSKKTGNRVFFNIRRISKIKPKDPEAESKPVTKMAIGVEGGFAANIQQYDITEETSIVVLPEWTTYDLSDPSLPAGLVECAAYIVSSESALKTAELTSLQNTWEGDVRVVSKYAESLKQLDNGIKIPPSGWKCSLCDLTTNLWLNLTDGTLLCGRKYWDGTGGNNHAVEYYEQTKYPLCVKLGTITPDGADVFSYAEDEMVLDPLLSQHLAHFGIDVMKMKQTDKTMVELEIDANQKIGEWDVIQESGSELTPIYGSGYTGLHNLGNSCYMNSALQVLFTTQLFNDRYTAQADSLLSDVSLDNIYDNFTAQCCRIGAALQSGEYSKQPSEDQGDVIQKNGITPLSFKLLVGKGHPEFSSKKQQDVHEFILHFFDLIQKSSRFSTINPVDSFRFDIEERLACPESGCVKYDTKHELCLSLPVDLSSATNQKEVNEYEKRKRELESQGQKMKVEETVRPRVTLKSCLDNFTDTSLVEDYFSTAVNKKVTAHRNIKIASYPKYLLIQVAKFVTTENWMPKKLDISLDVPDELDLSQYKSAGRQPDEKEFPESDKTEEEVVLNEEWLSQLMGMGFTIDACKRALYKSGNTGPEAATNWALERMGDADFNDPFEPPSSKKAKTSSNFEADSEGTAMIISMGFTQSQAVKALKNTDNNVERAVEWIFSHPDELNEDMDTTEPAAPPQTSSSNNTSSRYRLKAFISHMGTSTEVGHYVCHIKKDGRWVIFNDEKVAESKHPPADLAYVYLYEQIN